MIDYKKSGVDIDKANIFIKSIRAAVKSLNSPEVIADIGPFAGIYSIKKFKKYRHPVLVSSTDGVGTKIKLCILTQKFWVAGYDLVAMNVNDIVTTGAKPLFFLDYLAMEKLSPEKGKEIIRGIVKGCRNSGMSLIGGETAELPGFYKKGDWELAGFALGIVEKDKIINPQKIKEKDVLIGISSSGLHSNGYSLVRKIFTPREVKSYWQKYLLKPTRIYVKEILSLIEKINVKALVHITGGGFYDNIERILPPYLDAVIAKKSWPVPAIFREIQKRAHISDFQMYRTFNMGIGFVVMISERDVARVKKIFYPEEIHIIGRIVKGRGKVKLQEEVLL